LYGSCDQKRNFMYFFAHDCKTAQNAQSAA
jgi:hypothetical protein